MANTKYLHDVKDATKCSCRLVIFAHIVIDLKEFKFKHIIYHLYPNRINDIKSKFIFYGMFNEMIEHNYFHNVILYHNKRITKMIIFNWFKDQMSLQATKMCALIINR